MLNQKEANNQTKNQKLLRKNLIRQQQSKKNVFFHFYFIFPLRFYGFSLKVLQYRVHKKYIIIKYENLKDSFLFWIRNKLLSVFFLVFRRFLGRPGIAWLRGFFRNWGFWRKYQASPLIIWIIFWYILETKENNILSGESIWGPGIQIIMDLTRKGEFRRTKPPFSQTTRRLHSKKIIFHQNFWVSCEFH